VKKIIIEDQSDIEGCFQPENWLNLESGVTVEVTSEDPEHPIESALLESGNGGWRSAKPGKQTIRLVFDQPQSLNGIQLRFVESSVVRTQQFVLKWADETGEVRGEIVRQQWNFNPTNASCEIENYTVQLTGVKLLELTIIPDIHGSSAYASMVHWRIK